MIRARLPLERSALQSAWTMSRPILVLFPVSGVSSSLKSYSGKSRICGSSSAFGVAVL